MIAMLRGSIDSVLEQSVILDVQGVGYEVFTSQSVLAQSSIGRELKLYLHHHIREDDERLFGFALHEELELFKKFLQVDGVGPKVALAIFSTYPFDQICRALSVGDERFFSSVSGLGKKTAAKIVLELKGKVEMSTNLFTPISAGRNDVLDALVSLGYAEKDVFGVIEQVDTTLSTDEQIKQALRLVARL